MSAIAPELNRMSVQSVGRLSVSSAYTDVHTVHYGSDDQGSNIHSSGIEELINWHHKQKGVENVKTNPLFLSYHDRNLEKDFERHYYNSVKRTSQIALVGLVLVTALLGVADFSYHSMDYDSMLSLEALVVIRYGVLVPLGCLLVMLSKTRSYRYYNQYALFIFNIIFGTGLSAMAVLGGNYAGYGTVFTFIFYNFFLTKSRFFLCSVSTIVIICAHYTFLYVKSDDDLAQVVPSYRRADWNRKIFNDVGVLALLDLCCMYGAYVQETTMRAEFLNAVIVQLESCKINHLLHNLLPSSAVRALRSGTQAIADHFPVATVLFSDIVGFTKLSGDKHPQEICILLHNLYCVFDRLTDIYGVYKVETIGDAYEAVSGLDMNDDSIDYRKLTTKEIELKSKINAASITNFGLSMLEQIPIINSTNNYPVNIRIGIHSGPVIAGVIGMKMPRYHLWGETVAIAEHLEAGGVEGAIQVSSHSKDLLSDYFILQRRGWIEISKSEDKKMETYLLIGAKEGGNDSISKQIEKARETLQNLVQERLDELEEIQKGTTNLDSKGKKKMKINRRTSLPVFGSIQGDINAQRVKFGLAEEKEDKEIQSGKFTSHQIETAAANKTGQKASSEKTVMALRKHTRRRTTFFQNFKNNNNQQQEDEEEEPYSPMLDNHQDETIINIASLGDNVVQLPRGGVMIKTALGYVQFGMPPETIKDAMLMKQEGATDIRDKMPVLYVIPHQLFDQKCGICMAEVEFPTYFNFFVLGRKPTFLTYPSVERRLRKVLRETLVGPSNIDIDSEYSSSFPKECRADILKECGSLRTFDDPDQLMEFIHFDKNSRQINITDALLSKLEASGSKNIDSSVQVVIKDVEKGYEIRENDVVIATVPSKIATESQALKKILDNQTPNTKQFQPPHFGVTILGSSHGFDPNRSTTGFVLWMNRRGIMVDPPINSSALLESYGIPARLIDAVMVTHCHADHDGGTLQKILAETQCTVISTTAILNSFIRKYSLLTNLEEEFLKTLFIARPAIVGEPILINGGEINVFYTMHTIPAIGIVAKFQGKTIYYSGDTCNDTELTQKMHAEGVMTTERKEFLEKQTWDYDIILHECGVPPIHTPVRTLDLFPDNVKERLWLVHIAEKDVPKDMGLKLAREGVENTLTIPIENASSGGSSEVLELLDTVPFFKGVFLTGDRAREVLQFAQNVTFTPGSLICKEGDRVESFFIIRLGIVNIDSERGKIHSKAYSGDYFGECCLLPGHLSNVDISALTEVEAVSFGGKELEKMLNEVPEVSVRINKMLDMQAFGFLDTLLCNTMFKELTSVQKTNLMSIAERHEINANEVLWNVGDLAEYCIIILSASIQLTVEVEKTKKLKFGLGSIIGDMNALVEGNVSGQVVTKAECLKRGMTFKISKENFADFIAKNPGLRMWCTNRLFIDSVHSMNRNVSRRQSISMRPEESLLDTLVADSSETTVIGNLNENNADPDGVSEAGDLEESPFTPTGKQQQQQPNDSDKKNKKTPKKSMEAFPGVARQLTIGKEAGVVEESDDEEMPDWDDGFVKGKARAVYKFLKWFVPNRSNKTKVVPLRGLRHRSKPDAAKRRDGGRMDLASIKLESFTNNISQITNRIFKGQVSWVGHSMDASLAECMVEGVVLKNTNIDGITLLFDYDRAESLFQLRLSNEIPWRRFNITCLLFFIAILGVYDYVMRVGSALESLLIVRFAGALPIAVAWFAFTFSPWYSKPKPYYIVSIILAASLGIACSFLSVVGKEPGYGGIMLYILFCGFFVRLRSIHTVPLLYAIAVLHTVVVGYFVISDQITKPWIEYKEENLFWSLGYLVVFSTLVNYMVFTLEYNQRTDFLGELGQKLERQKSHIVLNNMLPESVAKELYGTTEFPICHEFSTVTLVFCSIDSFESHVTKVLDSVQVVELLNTIFFVFDILVDRHQLYKVETVGDMYLAASGMPEAKYNHAQLIANFVSQLLILKTDDWVPSENNTTNLEVKINFGMSSGPVVAGIIGVHRPFYHVFGDTVNTASRMITTGLPGTCQMTEASYQFLKGKNYLIEERGMIQVKGKGLMKTFFLSGCNEDIDNGEVHHIVKEKRKSLLRTFAEGSDEDVVAEMDDMVSDLRPTKPKMRKKRSRFLSMAKGK